MFALEQKFAHNNGTLVPIEWGARAAPCARARRSHQLARWAPERDWQVRNCIRAGVRRPLGELHCCPQPEASAFIHGLRGRGGAARRWWSLLWAGGAPVTCGINLMAAAAKVSLATN